MLRLDSRLRGNDVRGLLQEALLCVPLLRVHQAENGSLEIL
jgi:hypothetical protein